MIKKINFKNSDNLNLVGNLWEANSNSIIIMAHGSGSNRFKNSFQEIAQAWQKQNFNVLSFDCSGHGESDDAVISLKTFEKDLKSAIDFVKSLGFEKIGLFGHSAGAHACLKDYSPDIKAMVLMGALSGPVKWDWKNLCTPEQHEQIIKTGILTADINDGLRKSLRIDGNLLNEIAQINQDDLLKNISCPVLIIHGKADQQELDLLPFSKQAIQKLDKNSKLVIIKEATHNFKNHIQSIIDLSIDWFKKYL